MYRIKSEVEFDMAHFLEGYDGKCSNIHGHRYRVIAAFEKRELHSSGAYRGMVEDFTVIKEHLHEISNVFDHKLVMEDTDKGRHMRDTMPDMDVLLVPYRPTAELMARDIYTRLKKTGLPVCSVEVFETPVNSCEYYE